MPTLNWVPRRWRICWDAIPKNWSSRPIAPSTKAIGDRWVKQQRSAVLKVPSIVVPEAFNDLLNPAHPDFWGRRVIERSTRHT